jgi:hypothetical protein
MDPYLEARGFWRDVHHRLITAIGDALTPLVVPRYYVAIEERTYTIEVDRAEFVSQPDVAIITASRDVEPSGAGGTATLVASTHETVLMPLFERIREGYLEVRSVETHQVVTVIEVLSPTNKMAGIGRQEYEAKRQEVLQSLTNLVEIDLLRGGRPMRIESARESSYRILVVAGWERSRGRFYGFGLRDPVPVVSVPLERQEPEPLLAVGTLVAELYDRARYDIRLRYEGPPPPPPLSPEEMEWIDTLLRERGLRA